MPRCLESLGFAREIIVLDSFSTDRTVEIAGAAGARVFQEEFQGFIEQKNRALSYATSDWVLSLDADEIVTADLARELCTLAQKNEGQPAFYRLPRRTFYLQRWIRHGGWYPDYNIRFFRTGSGQYVGGTVHEKFQAREEGAFGTVQEPLLHYSYDSIAMHVDRINTYSSRFALDAMARGRRSSIGWAFLKSISKFWLTYVWHLGFLDGRPGFVIAVLAGYYNFLKYAKLWEGRSGRSHRP